MKTLLSSATRLFDLTVVYFTFLLIFGIIGVNLMMGATHYRCRTTPYPVNGDWKVVPGDNAICGGFHECEIACGSLYETTFTINGTETTYDLYMVTDLSRDSGIK